MEILTYSLWFTLIWWVLVIISLGWTDKETEIMESKHYIRMLILSTITPAFTILFEYLLVR